MYYHHGRKLRAFVHGDDYATVGTLAGLRWLQKHLESLFEMKTVIAGHSNKQDVVTEAKKLNRVIRAVPSGWEYECNRRHVELFLEEMQMKDCKCVGMPELEALKSRGDHDDE